MNPRIITANAEPYVRARRLAARTLLLAGLVCCASYASAQKIGVQGDRLTVDGTPKFLTFVSYFGGMGAPNVIADLHLMKTLGFDGFRIWPMLDTGPQIMNGDGSLRSSEMAHFLSILDQARQERLVTNLGAGRTTIKKYRFPGVEPPKNGKIRSGVKELSGTRILNEEVEHEAWFIELLSMERDKTVRPSGRFRRSAPGEAPYSKNHGFYNP